MFWIIAKANALPHLATKQHFWIWPPIKEYRLPHCKPGPKSIRGRLDKGGSCSVPTSWRSSPGADISGPPLSLPPSLIPHRPLFSLLTSLLLTSPYLPCLVLVPASLLFTLFSLLPLLSYFSPFPALFSLSIPIHSPILSLFLLLFVSLECCLIPSSSVFSSSDIFASSSFCLTFLPTYLPTVLLLSTSLFAFPTSLLLAHPFLSPSSSFLVLCFSCLIIFLPFYPFSHSSLSVSVSVWSLPFPSFISRNLISVSISFL